MPRTARRTVSVRRKDRGGEEWRALGDGAMGYRPGRDADVVRKARANIPRIRGRDVELRVVDRRGRPLARRRVEAVQTKSAFLFGNQLWALDRYYRYNQHDTDTGRYYRKHFARLFNAANALCYWTERPSCDGPKIEDLQGENVTSGFDYCVNWAASQGLTVKGHPLFWSIDKCVPEWVKRYDYETQMKFAEVRVRNMVARFKNRVRLWDAVNEALWEPAFKNLSKRHWPHIDPVDDIADYISKVLKWCRDEDPDACFVVNEYGLEKDWKKELRTKDGRLVTGESQRRRMLELVEALRRRGAPPDAIGMQAHTGGWLRHSTQWDTYDVLGQAGLPLHITEFWASTRELKEEGRLSDEDISALQSEYVVNYVTCALGHPAIEGFFCWDSHILQQGNYSSHETIPAFEKIRETFDSEWTTRWSGATDSNGVVRFHGFFGDYSLRHELSPGVWHGERFVVDGQAAMPLTIVLA